jgi:hypothetical protein
MAESYKPVVEYFIPPPNTATKLLQNQIDYGVPKRQSQSQSFIPTKQTQLNSEAIPPSITIRTNEIQPFCNDAVSIDPLSTRAVNANQRLSAGQFKGLNVVNPRTRIAPVVIAPSHDLDYWKDNELITHSSVNRESAQTDMYLSGYAESTCCDIANCNTPIRSRIITTPTEEFYQPRYTENGGFDPTRRPIVAPRPTQDRVFLPSIPVQRVEPQFREEYREDFQFDPENVNSGCGYDPYNVNVGLPSNFPAGKCEKDPAFKRYNENLFTSIITPGVYSRTQVDEPINSNIGISYQQQFEPVSRVVNEEGVVYTQHDPNLYTPPPQRIEADEPSYSNVYDPRFNGYGTSYRSYIDEVTGQPRFMYDDINSVRMPNYIARSKIDFLPYADTYGSVSEDSGNADTPYIRQLAQNSWLDNSLQFRDDLTERRMRKINAVAWQRRQAPLRNV